MSAIHPSASIGFSTRADAYVQGRPGYPPDVDHWLRTDLSLSGGKTTLDLGAGTGKFLPYLVATGATIVAVEPVAAMRHRLIESFPSVEAMDGTAQNPACRCDPRRRPMRPVISLVRQSISPGRDPSRPETKWFARPHLEHPRRCHALGRGDRSRHSAVRTRNTLAEVRSVATAFPADGFGPLSERFYEHGHRGDPEKVIIERILSVSYIAALGPEEQGRVIRQIREIIATAPELAGRSEVTFPYRTAAYHCRKL